jgi:hypothetical protein
MSKKGISFILSEGETNGIEVLNDKERDYFMLMRSQSGVLYLLSKPGIGKSAILTEMAEKLNYNYFDIRLSMIDETDLGLYPDKKQVDGETFLIHITPYWAELANKRPSIVHFEELNRTRLSVRNAALQILLERKIGSFFAFNENVYMVSSGNLGDKDQTDVEEFDKALDGRLIQIYHELSLDEWIEYFAQDNVHYSIIDFLLANPEYYYKYPSESSMYRSYASPRTWTFMSDFITTNYGKDAEPEDFIDYMMKYGYGFVGDSITPYIRYCRTNKITIQDVLNDYDNVKEELFKYTRDKKSELLVKLKTIRFNHIKVSQLSNLTKFITTLSDDEVVSYFDHLLKKDYMYKSHIMNEKEKMLIDKKNERIKKFFAQKEFSHYKEIMKEIFEKQYNKIMEKPKK